MSEAAASPQAHPLDHVVWNALTGKQRHVAVGDERARRFPAGIGPFAALADTGRASFGALRSLIETHGRASLVTLDAVTPPPGLVIARKAMLLQMVWQREPDPAHRWEHVELSAADAPDMLALATATQPGPFGPRTHELGDFVGVRKDGRLAAMAGVRMRLDGYTEISGVCVDPAFRGQGHAAGLMRLLIATLCARGETPFLHVITTNTNAMAIYRTMGFVERREMHLTVLDTAQTP